MSAVLVLVGAGQLVASPPEVAADVPVEAQVALPLADPDVPEPVHAVKGAAPAPAWRTRSSAPSRPKPVAPPERLVARSVGLDLPVAAVGVDDEGQMALPEEPTRLGWYRFGAAPADRRGAVVLGGHVDSVRYGVGPLARAAHLRRGDRLELRDSRGRTTTYAVVRVQRVSKSRFSGSDVFERSGPALLRLVTCAGAYDRARGGYQDNLVVTAERR